MYFEWDDHKNRQNFIKHDIRFETAVLVFDDPHALTRPDPFSEDEERWITIGAAEQEAIMVVVHTWRERNAEEIIRIISARPAESREKRIYEEAQQGTKARNRSHRRKKRRGH
jgi:uncharacterized protein